MVNIKYLRMEKHLTQTELAERIGTSKQYLSTIENGKIKPGKKMAQKLGDVLGVDWKMLL